MPMSGGLIGTDDGRDRQTDGVHLDGVEGGVQAPANSVETLVAEVDRSIRIDGEWTLANDLEQRFPEDTSVRFSYVPAIRGACALRQGEPQKAINILQAALPNERGFQRSNTSPTSEVSSRSMCAAKRI